MFTSTLANRKTLTIAALLGLVTLGACSVETTQYEARPRGYYAAPPAYYYAPPPPPRRYYYDDRPYYGRRGYGYWR